MSDAVDARWVVEMQGKQFVLYAGLLAMAHDRGLSSIKTTLLQAPCQENQQTCIVAAAVEFDDHARFGGIGDANPGNVTPRIVPHLIRMAETRAKARALRDALNIGMCSVEELGGDDPPENGHAPRHAAPANADAAYAPTAKGVLWSAATAVLPSAGDKSLAEALRGWLTDLGWVGGIETMSLGQADAFAEELRHDPQGLAKHLPAYAGNGQPKTAPARCRSCQAEIYWLKTKSGKNMPVDAGSVDDPSAIFDKRGGHISHWDTCPNSEQHRTDRSAP